MIVPEARETQVPRDPDLELGWVLGQASHAIIRAREDELRQIGITSIQAAILYIAKVLKEPVTTAILSRWLLRERHTIWAILDRMEKQGLVKKIRNRPRKDVVRVPLTDKGEKTYAHSIEAKAIRNIVSCLSLEERNTLKNYAEKLRDKAIKEHRGTPTT